MIAALLASCGKTRVGQTEEEAPRLATVLHVSDERASAQLVSGFYELEANTWRWTAGHFSVLLRPPRSAAKNGAVLKLNLAIPDPIIAQLHSVTLTASINGTSFPSQRYSKTGNYVYSADVPANLLGGDSVKVDFAVDKPLPPGQRDGREFGVIVSSVGFEPRQ